MVRRSWPFVKSSSWRRTPCWLSAAGYMFNSDHTPYVDTGYRACHLRNVEAIFVPVWTWLYSSCVGYLPHICILQYICLKHWPVMRFVLVLVWYDKEYIP